MRLEHQLTDNPEVSLTPTKSPSLRHSLHELDNIIEVSTHHSEQRLSKQYDLTSTSTSHQRR